MAPRHRRDGREARGRGRGRHAELLPAEADPERDRAAGRARRSGSRRRLHALLGHAGPAHPAGARGRDARPPRVEAARRRAGRRRRIRVEAGRVRRGAPRARARPAPEPPGEVGRGALGELPRDDPRPRRRDRVHAGGDEGRDDHPLPREGSGGDGGVPPARDAGDPAPRGVDLRRPVRHPELQRRVHGRVHEHDADGRLSRCRAARGDLRDREDDGRPRGRARHGPARAPTQELHHGVPGDDGLGPHDRLRRLPRVARQAPRDARPRLAPGRAAEAPRQRRREAARRRVLDLQRDVRARAVAHPRGDPLRRRRAGTRRRSASTRPARSR